MDLEKQLGTGFSAIDALEDLYSEYLKDPQNVDVSWRKVFSDLDQQKATHSQTPPTSVTQTSPSRGVGDARVEELIQAYRIYGHLRADINPLESNVRDTLSYLTLEHWGLKPNELSEEFPTFGVLEKPRASLLEIEDALKSIYCNKVGVEYVGFCGEEVEEWLKNKIEPLGFHGQLSLDQKHMILQCLNRSEMFESFLHMKYPGQKRFSLEGAESLIPMLAGIIDKSAEFGTEEFYIGMAHRGRLNVLSNILNKSYEEIFSEFDEGYIQDSFEGTGDVKYHKGYYSNTISSHGHQVKIIVTPNPSHLEAVDPVVEGQVKARQIIAGSEGVNQVMPVLIHGDASVSGQGIVYELMQFAKLPGYSTGGTIHFVINNQIGFTTLPKEGRSTLYCTDIAKSFGSPIFHVNGEDPESCLTVALLALEIRKRFNIDVFIDLVCYRKYGHNESDEPAYTQPQIYQLIRKKRPIRESYRETLIANGDLDKELAAKLEREFKSSLQESLERVKESNKETAQKNGTNKNQEDTDLIFKHMNTGVDLPTLREIAEKLSYVPAEFKINSKLENLVRDRLSMIAEGVNAKPIDWGMAELLAYGSILNEGFSVRLSGQDCCRGTFSHRHAMWVDQQNSSAYFPLQHISETQGRFDVYNSPLSEYAILGFEFGYSVANPKALVLWEAQFGDFGNGAQIVIDQFIATAEQKWGQKFNVVLLLPHGYEGQGPEHSSARIERFLTLAGQQNMVIVNPTTPAQLFHLLRRQVKTTIKKPLIVFTPKGLLRHPECVSKISDLCNGSFQEVLDDPMKQEAIKSLVFCSGRIYYDLVEARAKERTEGIAIVRIEQLYPLDVEVIRQLMHRYNGFTECIWIQEEPINMGACLYMSPLLENLLPKGVEFRCIARPRSASPAVGSHALHDKEHQVLIEALFGHKQPSIFELAGKKHET